MADLTYSKRASDRREGRQLRSLPESTKIIPFILRRRSDAQCTVSDSMEVSGIEQWLREKRGEGWSKLGILHIIVAAYVRTVTMRPEINRFVAGRRFFARNDIQVVLYVKRNVPGPASETRVKVSFSPTDTVFDVYRRLDNAMDAEKADLAASEPEKLAKNLMKLPRFMLRIVMAGIRALDYFDWLPRSWLNASPYHASLALWDLGSPGILPADPRIPDFGTISTALSFRVRRRVQEPGDGGKSLERHYVDYRFSCDERIVNSYSFATALKCMKYFLINPSLLELPPERIEEDVT